MDAIAGPGGDLAETMLASAGCSRGQLGIRESIDRRTAPVVADSVQVIPGELGDRAELLGGAALARQRRLDAVRARSGAAMHG